MAHLERLQKSFEALKIVQVTSRLERVAFDKAHPPIRLLKNEAQLGKNEFIQHCNTITESICSPLIRNHDGFLRLLTLACETLLILADDDDTDVRLAANDSLDKICLTYESNLSRIIYVLYREIEKNGSSRSLRVALSKFADLVGFIRPAKYRAYINKLFPCVARIVTTRADDELLQETLYSGFLARVAPTLVPYASEREITSLLAAYLPNLNCGANLVRRSAALALVALCSHARRPQFCFKWLLGNSLNMLSLVKVSTTTNSAAISNPANSSEVVSSERIFSGIFVLAKFLCPKVMRLLDTDSADGDVLSGGGGGGGGKGGGPGGISAEDYEILFDNMIFLYQHLLTSLKYSTSSVVIVAALEALLEYVLSMPGSVYRRIASLGEGGDGQQQSSALTPSSLNINLSRSPTALSGGGGGGPLTSGSSSRMGRDHLDRHRYESNLSITSSINYIENINDEQFTASSSVADEDDGRFFYGSEKRKTALSRHSGSAALLDGSSSSGDHHQQQNSFSYSFDDRRSVTTADGGFAGGGGGTGSEFGDNESSYFGGGGGGDDAVFSEVNFDADSNSNKSEMNSEFGGDYHHRQMTFDEDVLSETYSSQKSPLLYAELAAAEGGGGSSNSQSGSSSAIDQFNLGPLYSLEYASKLLCLKFLLVGRRGQLMTDEVVRVSIKSLALSTFAALVHVYPEALLLGVEGSGDKDEEGENASDEDGERIPSSNYQPFTDVLLYSTHSDPNLKGAVALLLGKFFDKLLSSPEPYSEFLSRHCQTETNSTDVQLGTLFSLLRRLATDQSTAIAVKQAIAAFALFLPKLITNVGGGGGGGDQQHQQLSGEEVLATLRELIALKDHPYWLVKVELVGLLAALPYNALAYLEKNCCSTGNRNKTLPVSLQRTILEEVVLPFSLDGDHRVRQATVGCLGTMVAGSLCLNSYLLNSDPVNVATFTWMLDNYHQRHSSGLLDLGSRPFLFADARTVSRPLDNGGKEEDEQNEDLHFPHQIESTFSLPLLGQLQHSLLSSNLHYFVRHYVHQLRTAYHRKQSLAGVVGAMAALAKRFPPSRYAEGWHIGGGVGSDAEHSGENNSSSSMNSGLSTATLLVELLTKSGSTMVDLPTHQHLLTLTADLLEGIVCQQAKRLQEKYCTSNAVSSTSSATTPPLRSYPSVPTSESAFFASISPTFSALTQAFFLHLLKVLVAHAAIAEDNPAIFVTFIHNLHSKHHHHQLSSLLKSSTSSGSSSGGKRPGSATSASSKGGHFGGRDKPLLLLEPAALKKELASKGSKKMEAFAYDPLYLRLFEYLKAYHRNKKSSIGGKAEKCALLSTSLRCMGQLMEVVDPHSPSSSSPSSSSSSSPTTVFHLLEDILVYLRLVFELDPTSVVATVRQLLRCAFAVNYVSLFVDLLADQLSGRLGPLGSSSISLATSSATITTPTTANTTTTTPTTTTAFKCEHMNSLYNSCLSMPYSRLNEFYNNCQRAKGGGGGTAAETENSIGFLTWLRERTQSKLGKTLNLSSPATTTVSAFPTTSSSSTFYSPSSSVLTDSEMKSLLIAKIQLLEPLVLKSFSRYKSTNDRRFQAALAELLATLVQLQVNFCSLDTDNVFIGHVLKQFEFLENVGTRELQAAYEPLMRRLFYFLVILSNGRYISEELVDLPKVIQLCDAFIANGHHQMAVQGLAIVVDDCFYFKGEHLTLSTGGSDSVANLEATREVVLAFAFKLLDHHPQAFDLLTMIVAYYQGSSRPRWSSLSATVIELLLPKLVDPNFERLISSAQAFESLQTLLYRLCPAVFTSPSSTVTFNLAAYIFKRRSSSSKSLWRTVLFLRLIIFNLNEAECLAKTEEIRESIDYISFGGGGGGGISGDDSPAGGDEANPSPDPPPPEELLASLLLGVLQQALGELAEDLGGYRSRRSSRVELTVYLLAQYTLSLAFVFQSGFFPRVTACATQLIGRCQLSKSGGAPAAKLQPVVVVVNDLPYDFATTNELFFRLAAFHPHLTISWLNLLYITNYERLPVMLSRLIDHQQQDHHTNSDPELQNSTAVDAHQLPQPLSSSSPSHHHLTLNINAHVLRRFALVLLCDYLTENLENVEYLSWLVINHLREIVDLCYEVPVREFIHSVHRRSSSSGLFLQAVNSRCSDQLSLNGNSTTTSVDPLFASKLLHCLERAHSSQSLPLVLFLLEQYLFNAALAPYYNCSKAAEVIAASRLASLYDLNDHATSAPPKATETIVVSGGAPETPPPPKNLLSLKDLSNLRKLLRNTSYVKLSYTVQTIKNQYFGVVGSSGSVSRSGRKKSAQIRDPLTESFQSLSGAAGGGDLRNSMPEINRRWFIGDILRPYWAVAQRSTPNAVHFLDKLANEDIGELVASEHFSLVNLKQILVYLVEKAKERGAGFGGGGGGNFSGHYQHKAAAAHLVESSNREELAKEMLVFCRRLMQYTLLRCPLQLATLLKERQFLCSEGEEEAFFSLEESQFSAVAFSFLPSFEFFLRHQSLLEAQAGGVSLLSADSPEQQCLDTDLLLVYATLVPPTFRQNRLVQLTDLLTLLRSALVGNGCALAAKIARPENIHVQSALIRAVYFVVEQCFTLSDEIELPAELTAFGRGSEQFERHIFADLKRVLLMFHWLEESESAPALKHRKHRKKRSLDSGVTSSAQWSSPLPPVLGRLLEELVISLAQLPFVNSLVYLPYSLFARKTVGHHHQSLTAAASPSGQHSFWREASFSGDFHTSTPIIGAQYLSNDLDLFRSFARRIELLGFVNRVQFEEIWMTLLGVYSDNLTFMSLQAKQQQPSISGERNTELNDSLQLGQLVVRSVTTLLLMAAGRNTGKNHHHHQQSSPVRQGDLRQNLHPHHHRLHDRRRTSKQSSSAFGDRFELIREALSRRSSELEEVLAQYNASTTSSSPCLQFADAWEGMGLGSSCGSRSFCSNNGSRNTSSESSPTGDSSSSSSSAQASSNDTSVDLYSCLHFLIDLYLQTVQVLTSGSTTTGQKDSHPLSTVCFPVFAEIGRSCLAVSELLFTEKSQYAKLLTLLHELARLVDAYEDELLNQSVIVALARTHAVLGFSDETIERAKRLVLEQHFKDFFLPTRIGAVRSVKHLLESRLLPLTTKELAPVCDYIAKHFTNEHCIPSSYSAEYVEELWSLALALVRRTSVPSLGGDFNDKVVKGLLRSLSKCGGGGRIHGASNVRSVCACLEQLLLMYSSSNQVGISAGKDHHQHTSKEVVVAIHSAALKQLTLCTGQLNSVSLLRLYVLASYLVSPGATNFPGRQPANVKSPTSSADIFGDDDELFSSLEQLSVIFEPLKTGQCNSLQAAALCSVLGHFLVDFFPAQDLLNKCIGEFLSNQQNHYKYLTDILFVIFNKFQTDFHHTDTAQDWVLLSLSSFTQLVPISHALWALTCFLMAASQNHWIRASYPYFQHRFGQFNERDKAAFFTICNNFYNEIKSEENKRAFIKTFQKAAASLPNSPYFDVLKYLCDI